ncbi:MAG: trypsin-like peptidase domain-containing protein [Gammaproteobacteria bacterium]|nr:trypsin-like peptidase domain-containing protein [Gammaproteobacteria bacterium]MYG14212.1 trypsin-like peptidase domain-containing protein [Gammaproteobacteria bacterium]MYK27232.1 trypsin-like peptidase domain-containing protein [Gammaproteobacteria bacterium]
MTAPTANIYGRTFHCRYNGFTGTCFSLDVDGKRYLITANHVVDGISDEGHIRISHKGEWIQLGVSLVGINTEKDVAVLAPEVPVGFGDPIKATSKGMIVGADVFFLGFPFGIEPKGGTEINEGFPVALVKKGIVAGLVQGSGEMFLDGTVAVGGSGGPVIRADRLPKEVVVVGVVTASQDEVRKVLDEHGSETNSTYFAHPGIGFATQIERATDLINANPIGPEVESYGS